MDGPGGSSPGPFKPTQAILSQGCVGMAYDSVRNRVWFTDLTWLV
jgi:hypothetical protein